MLRVIWLLVLAAACACTNDAGSQPDANGATPQSIVAANLGLAPHLGMKMTKKVRACRLGCWDQTPYGACTKQRDACLKTANSDDDKHACRKASYACGQTRRQCMQGCWAEDPAANLNGAALAATKPHLGMTMTPQVRACRQTCWSQIPFNACAKQRDTCLASASTRSDRHHCREMSLTCRKMRTACMQGCWVGIEPSASPLEPDNAAEPGDQIEQSDD